MKLARIHGPDDVRLDDVEAPVCGPDDVILDVGACGICGSDVGYARLGGVTGPADTPMPIGHELAGTVSEVGVNCGDVAKVGDRVALHPGAAGFGLGNGGPEGGFTPRLLVRGAAQGKSLFAIPDGMSFAHGALAEPLGVGMHAVDQSEAKPGDKVAVLGAGPIGLSAIATLADRGIEDIVSVDMSTTRLDVARKLGATHTVNPSEEDLWEGLGRIHGTETLYWMKNVGTNVFIEATGVGPLLADVVRHCAPQSRISVVALHRQEVPIAFMDVLTKEVTLRGSIEYPADYGEMIRLLARRDLEPMITHRFGLDDFLEAFDVARSPDAGAKVMIEIA
ncbi:MAG: alcohol dehydrogenase [Deltaproteobacteria bacterium]|nr:alcohol dehydrogenase [Deltaproteobacteria bacterium]